MVKRLYEQIGNEYILVNGVPNPIKVVCAYLEFASLQAEGEGAAQQHVYRRRVARPVDSTRCRSGSVPSIAGSDDRRPDTRIRFGIEPSSLRWSQ